MLGGCCNVDKLLSIHEDLLNARADASEGWGKVDALQDRIKELESENAELKGEIAHFEKGCRCCRGTRPILLVGEDD